MSQKDFSDDPEGVRGELIERLIAVLDDEPDVAPEWWHNLGVIVAMNVGRIHRVPLNPDQPFPPGSVGAQQVERYGGATRTEYMALLRERALHLVADGVTEDFLVRALRDELLRWAARMADTEGVDERRTEMREGLRRRADDPDAIAGFRDSLADRNPEYANLSNDEIRQMMLDMAAKSHLDPLGPEHVTNHWAVQQRLQHRCEEVLGDETIDAWQRKLVFREMDS